MFSGIYNKLPSEFKKFSINKIESGASKKNLYRLSKKNNSFILMDFCQDKKEYASYLNIYNLLKDIEISIPKILDKNDKEFILIVEDFGDLRFDKILDKYSLKKLLKHAVNTLVVLNQSIEFDNSLKLEKYSFSIFKNEISELTKFYFPYIGIKDKKLTDEFINIWSLAYKKNYFLFNNFVHKDFNINNLIFIKSRKDYLKCGIIDFQNAFWGESCWDLFSLLEDSRILFSDEYNQYFLKYYHTKTQLEVSLQDFKHNFNFLNTSRQTRLLGRWVKLSNDTNQKWYLNFLSVTKNRLQKSINSLNDTNITKFYNKYVFEK